MRLFQSSLLLALHLLALTAVAQYVGHEKIPSYEVSDWPDKNLASYEGVYHFGSSEGESELVVFRTGGLTVAQVRSGSWNEDATAWVSHYTNLQEADFDALGQFSSDQYKGAFVIRETAHTMQKGLKIYDSWSGVTQNPGEYEVGLRIGKVASYFAGRYPKGSMQLLSQADLLTFTKADLQIMRNEIFARYGYRFRKGGMMAQYFGRQKWYQPQHEKVDQFLTLVEKKNIQLIKAEEDKRD